MISFNLIRKILPGLLVFGLLVGFGCSSPSGSDDDDGGNGGGNGGDDPVTYELSVQTSPAEGGSVDPESGTYEEDEEVEVTASAADGWEFDGWSGDISSSENPLTFTITENISLTANFVEAQAAYSNQIELTDASHTETLLFGMDEQATGGYDSGLDNEAPPAPPAGSFYAHFVIEGYNLFNDYRPVESAQTVWEIHFSPSSSNTMTLNWDFSSSNHIGSLTLVDDLSNASVEIDMETETSYEVTGSDIDVLYIVQQ